MVKTDTGDLNKDGFNESEGRRVLEGAGPLRFTSERGQGSGFAPAFKVVDWKGKAPQTVKADGKEVPAAVVEGKLLLQVLGRVPCSPYGHVAYLQRRRWPVAVVDQDRDVAPAGIGRGDIEAAVAVEVAQDDGVGVRNCGVTRPISVAVPGRGSGAGARR